MVVAVVVLKKNSDLWLYLSLGCGWFYEWWDCVWVWVLLKFFFIFSDLIFSRSCFVKKFQIFFKKIQIIFVNFFFPDFVQLNTPAPIKHTSCNQLNTPDQLNTLGVNQLNTPD